jgi:hypothetical protein
VALAFPALGACVPVMMHKLPEDKGVPSRGAYAPRPLHLCHDAMLCEDIPLRENSI